MLLIYYLLLNLIVSKPINNNNQCKSEIMKYYGLVGIYKPIPYTSVLDEGLNKNPCPAIESSCCTNRDF